MTWPDIEFAGNAISEWLVAAGIAAFVMIVLWLVRALLRRRFANAHLTETDVDDLLLDLVNHTRLKLMLFPVIVVAMRMLELPSRATTVLHTLAIIAFLVQTGIWITGLVDWWLGRHKRQRMASDPGAATTIAAAGFVLKLIVWAIVLLGALDNIPGVEVTTLIAGLGVGGIAVALATQNILGDLFASLSIVLDKPFVIGDFITVDQVAGTVESVGIKTTRIRSISGEQVIVSNGDLLKSRIRNFKRMSERRIVGSFGVTYQTPREKLERVPAIVRQAVETHEIARFDRAHFFRFGESSLDFEYVYLINSPDYVAYMDVQQAIQLDLVSRFHEEGIEFAFPTRQVVVTAMPAV